VRGSASRVGIALPRDCSVLKAALTLTRSRGERGPEKLPPPAQRGGGPGWGVVFDSVDLASVPGGGPDMDHPPGID